MVLATPQGLKQYFSSHGFDCDILPKSEELDSEQLVVALGGDDKGRDLLLSIRFAELPLNQELLAKDNVQGGLKSYHFAHFSCCFPFQVQEASMWEIGRVLFLLNRGLELPGFELSELEKIVYYRYVLAVTDKHIEEPLLICLLGTIDQLVKGFIALLEQVAIGAKTAQELIDEMNDLIDEGE